MTGTIILMISYGYPAKEHDDPLVCVVEAAVNAFAECLVPGTYLVDMIPICESLFFLCTPLWIPMAPSYHEQCDTSLNGSLERGGKRRPSGMQSYWNS